MQPCKSSYLVRNVKLTSEAVNYKCVNSCIVLEPQFQVLVDTTSTSRLEWQKWDIFTKRPFGVVAFSDKALVARVKRPTGTSAVKVSISSTFYALLFCNNILLPKNCKAKR